MGLPGQEYWSVFPTLGDVLDPVIESVSPALFDCYTTIWELCREEGVWMSASEFWWGTQYKHFPSQLANPTSGGPLFLEVKDEWKHCLTTDSRIAIQTPNHLLILFSAFFRGGHLFGKHTVFQGWFFSHITFKPVPAFLRALTFWRSGIINSHRTQLPHLKVRLSEKWGFQYNPFNLDRGAWRVPV